MMPLAAIRPDSWNLPLLVHVAGAMVLVGALATASLAMALGWRDQVGVLRRLAYRTLLFAALPAFVVMRVGAAWVSSKEGWDDVKDTPTWLGIGFITSDAGAVLLVIALILGGLGLRRDAVGQPSRLLRASGAIAMLLTVVYLVTVWAMAGKPS
jgi:hypothetical protein